MAKISNTNTYPTKATPVSADYVIGTDASSKETKTFTLQSIANLYSGSGAGTVTSVGFSLSGLAGLTLTGDNPIIGAGTITLGINGNPSSGQYLDYQGNWSTPSGSGTVTGTGTANTLSKWSTGGTGIENSTITDTGSVISIGNPTILKGDGTTNGNASNLKFNCSNNNHWVEFIGPNHSGSPASYSITLPNKIATQTAVTGGRVLEINGDGVGNWITTPSGLGSIPLATNNSRGGIKIGFSQSAKDYPVQLSNEQAYVNVPWTDNNTTYSAADLSNLGLLKLGSNTTLTASYQAGSAGTGVSNRVYPVQLNSNDQAAVYVPWTGSGSQLGFSPLSIYEAPSFIASVAGEAHLSVMRQSVCETDCTIDKVDFFRLTGTETINVYVYTGNIAAGTGTLVLSGTQNSGTANSVNTITFATPHTFSAGDDIVIVISLRQTTGYASQVAGASTTLLSNLNLSREAAIYVSNPNSDLSTELENFTVASAKGAALHFYGVE